LLSGSVPCVVFPRLATMAMTRLSAPQARAICLHYYSSALRFNFGVQEEVYRLEKIKEWEPVDKNNVELFMRIISGDDRCNIFLKFFKFYRSYDLLPTSSKLVVFDTQLLVKKAFNALVLNGVRAALIWDSSTQRYIGMLTITDFIRILSMNYKSHTLEMEELEHHKISTWRDILHDENELIYTNPDASLYEAIKMLVQNKIHRLPVLDQNSGNILSILTHKRIVRFLFLHFSSLPQSKHIQQSIFKLKVGTFSDVEVALEETSIIEALNKFEHRRVSALPIVDSQGKLVDIYTKFDVINLAAEKTYSNLDVNLRTANQHQHRNEWFEGVHKCRQDESLLAVMERIVKAEVHRLVVVDDDNKVTGIVSLSDILHYLVQELQEVDSPAAIEDPGDIPMTTLINMEIQEERNSYNLLSKYSQTVPHNKPDLSPSPSTESALEATEEILEAMNDIVKDQVEFSFHINNGYEDCIE